MLIRPDDFEQDLEDKPVKEGMYELQIADAEYIPTKKGDNHMLHVTFKIQGDAGSAAPLVHHYFLMWGDNDEDRVKRFRLRDLKRFLVTFGVSAKDGFDPEEQASELVGLEGKCRVVVEDYEGSPSNKLRLPKVDV